jgi:hypothetical protein
VRQHRLMRGMGEVFAFLEMPGRFAVQSRCLLVMRRGGLEMFLFAVFTVHGCSCALV